DSAREVVPTGNHASAARSRASKSHILGEADTRGGHPGGKGAGGRIASTPNSKALIPSGRLTIGNPHPRLWGGDWRGMAESSEKQQARQYSPIRSAGSDV